MILFQSIRTKARQEMVAQVIEKFEQLYDEYYSSGDLVAANLTVDMIAYLQDDFEAFYD